MAKKSNTSYPSQYESKVVLKDGSAILFRPIKTSDTEKWLTFYNGLSDHTKYLRMHYIPKQITQEEALRYCTVDYENTFAFVAEAIIDKEKNIVAVGRYAKQPSGTTAEIAFVIDDEYQEKGIGTKLIEWLALVARNHDIDTFEGLVLQENHSMLSVFQGYGFHMKKETRENAYLITFPLTKTPEVVRKKEERALIATTNSLRHIMKPAAVAVIGASNRQGSLGQLVFQSVMQNGYTGTAYPVTAGSNSVMSVRAYKSILEIEDNIDLAIIVVPSSAVLKVADECGRKKVKGIIVISDGFQERGPEGAALERELRDIAFGYGMRIIGPNCMGMLNTDPHTKLNATFSLIFPPHGNIAFMTQSGALGLGILQYAKNLDIGFSSYVSVGNRADIASTDMLQYWENDPDTKVILLYLESFDNPDTFSRISKRVSAKKPILAVKGGSTPAGSKAAASHTGAMATSNIVTEALFQQAGIIRVDTIEELFHSALALANQPVPRGNRVAILTNGGGPGTLAADTCAMNGLVLAEISPETHAKLKSAVKREIGISNPFDLTAGASAEEFENSLKILAEDNNYDAVITIYIPPAGQNISGIEKAISNALPVLGKNNKPVLSCFVGQANSKGKEMEGNQLVPYYPFPEDAAMAMANAVRYGEMTRKEAGVVPLLDKIDQKKSKQIIRDVLTSSPERPLWLQPGDMNELFKNYNVHFTEIKVAATAKETASAAEKLGFPVVIKLNSSTITHKSDVRGVILDIKNADEAEKAFNEIASRLKKIGRENEMQGVMVQHMVKEGAEVIVGVTKDPTLGHVIMFGLGGVYAELLKDTALRLHPLTNTDARELINSVKMSKLLKGYRGSEPLDTDALEELLLRVSAMVESMPQITEMDMNPVKVLPKGQGYCVVDSRIMIT